MLSNKECIYGTDHVSIDAVFKYNPKMHNVVIVNKDEEFFCRAGAVGDDTYTSGYDKLELSSQGPMYAISSKPGDCEGGMKLEVHITTHR